MTWTFVLDVVLRVVSLVSAFVAGWCLATSRFHRRRADLFRDFGDAIREFERRRERAPWN